MLIFSTLNRNSLRCIGRTIAIAAGLLIGVADSLQADDLPPLKLWDQLGIVQLRPVPPACRLNLPPESFEFDAIGVAQSPEKFDPWSAADIEANKRVRFQQVDVTTTERPVVLLLNSHYATTWDIRRSEGARILGVVFVGEGPMNIKDEAPIAGATVIDASRHGVCAQNLGQVYDSKHFKTLNALAEMIAGKPLTTFQGRLREGPFIVGPGAMDVGRLQPPNPTLVRGYPEEDFDGLKPLIAAGKIRIASEAEVYEWQTQDAELSHYGLVKDRHRRIYRIQEPITFPPAMTSTNTRFFLLPAGMALPAGDWGDNVVDVVEPIQGCGSLWLRNVCVDRHAVQGARGPLEPLPEWAVEATKGVNAGRQVDRSSAKECRIEKLPADFDFVAVGIRTSGARTGHWATTSAVDAGLSEQLALIGSLKIAPNPRPMVLLLTSRRWVRWDIDNSANARIEAIILSGPSPAMISGLRPGDQPVVINAAVGGACAQDSPAAVGMFEFDNLTAFSKGLIGRPPDRFLAVPDSGALVIGPPTSFNPIVFIALSGSAGAVAALVAWYCFGAIRARRSGRVARVAELQSLRQAKARAVRQSARSSPLNWWQIALPPLFLTAGLLAGAMLGAKPATLTLYLSGLFVLIAALWLTRRAAAALGTKLGELDPESGEGNDVPPSPWRYIAGRLVLPGYVTILCLATGSFLALFTMQPASSPVTVVCTFLKLLVLALLGIAVAMVTVLAIWRKSGSAGWIARSVAQLTAAGAFAFAAISAPADLALNLPRNGLSTWWKADYPFSWYGLAIDARIIWLGVMVVLIVFGFGSIVRLWRARSEGPGLPWMMPLFLVLMLGLLCGVSSITGPYLSHWIVGSFVMARLATYVVFLYEPKDVVDFGWMAERLRGGHGLDALRCMPGWLSAYLLTTALGGFALAHHLATGQFGMLIHPLLNELTMPLGLSSRFWSYYIAFWLFLTRDILFLLCLNLSRPGRWNDLLGVAALLFVLLIAASARGLGFGFLMPVLVPGFVLEPVDLLWPVATVLGLALMILRAWSVRVRFA